MTHSNNVKLVLDCSTGEAIYTPLTESEILQIQENARIYQESQAQALELENRIIQIKESAKAKLVAGEPLTEEEASALLAT
jgi:hypothetical protein